MNCVPSIKEREGCKRSSGQYQFLINAKDPGTFNYLNGNGGNTIVKPRPKQAPAAVCTRGRHYE